MAFTLAFPFFGGTLNPITGIVDFDSEISVDSGAFTDCTNEATEIGSSGWYTLEIEDSEHDGASLICIQVKSVTYGTIGFVLGLGDISETVVPFPNDVAVSIN